MSCQSGTELKADIIITATGLNVQLFGGIALQGWRAGSVEPNAGVQGHDASAYPTCLCGGLYQLILDAGVPAVRPLHRLLGFMDSQAITSASRRRRMKSKPSPAGFGAGYVQQALDSMPRQASRALGDVDGLLRDISFAPRKVADECLGSARCLTPTCTERGASDSGRRAMTADRFCELPGKRSLCYRSHGPKPRLRSSSSSAWGCNDLLA